MIPTTEQPTTPRTLRCQYRLKPFPRLCIIICSYFEDHRRGEHAAPEFRSVRRQRVGVVDVSQIGDLDGELTGPSRRPLNDTLVGLIRVSRDLDAVLVKDIEI